MKIEDVFKRTRTYFLCLFAVIFCTVICTGCKNVGGSLSDGKFRIVSSCLPVHIILLNLVDGIESVSATCMTSSETGCLHDFVLTPKDMREIEQASVFVINGAGMEVFLDKIFSQKPHLKIIDSSKNIELIKLEHHDHHHEHEHDDDCCHGDEEYDPHIWLSVPNYIIQVQTIRDELCELNPENAKKYSENAEKYIEKLSELNDSIIKETKEFKSKNVITFHDFFAYFSKEYGFNIVYCVDEPKEGLSANKITKIIKKIKEKKVAAILVQYEIDSLGAKIIADESRVPLHVFDPGTKGEANKDLYLNIMAKNLDTLKLALGRV